jgi:hypothetical protein
MLLKRRHLLIAAMQSIALPHSSNHGAGAEQPDDTVSLQAAVDRLPIGGVLDGGDQTRTVGTIRLKSHMTLQNFKLVAKASATPLTAPVTLDGQTALLEDITIRNVHVLGTRSLQTNLMSPEDGGRDGFRMVGRARNIWIIGCSAEYCGTDGLKIFSANALSGDDNRLNFEDIFVIGCRFNWNRRQGISGDSLKHAIFIDTEFSHNGIDIEGGKTEGARGARDRGFVYAAGADIEGYGLGCGIDGLYFINCTGLGNARHGIQFWDIADPSSNRFVARRKIRIESCKLDGGISPHHGRQALEFSLPAKYRGRGPMYEDVTIQNPTITGTVVLCSARHVQIEGGTVRSPYAGFWGIAEGCSDIRVQGLSTENKILAQR